MLSAKNISKTYPHPIESVRVLTNLSLEAKAGESIAIVGESGRGKTTLLYLLSGLDRIDQGEIFIQNTRIDNISEKELSCFRSKYFGFIFQHHFLMNDLTAFDNAIMPLRINNKLSKETKQYAEHLFEELNLSHRMHHHPEEMSGGECQRTAVIRALVNNPLMIFADEPTGSLDSENAHKLEEILFDILKKHNSTLIISTHNQRLATYCSRKVSIDELEQ